MLVWCMTCVLAETVGAFFSFFLSRQMMNVHICMMMMYYNVFTYNDVLYTMGKSVVCGM